MTGVQTCALPILVMGGHGDTMVPLPRFTKISGKSLDQLIDDGKISKERLKEIVQRTRDGGAEIIKFLEKGSAFYAPAASGVEMAESYLKNLKKLLFETKKYKKLLTCTYKNIISYRFNFFRCKFTFISWHDANPISNSIHHSHLIRFNFIYIWSYLTI